MNKLSGTNGSPADRNLVVFRGDKCLTSHKEEITSLVDHLNEKLNKIHILVLTESHKVVTEFKENGFKYESRVVRLKERRFEQTVEYFSRVLEETKYPMLDSARNIRNMRNFV